MKVCDTTRQRVQVLFELFANKVREAAYFVVRDNNLAEDIMQETFLVAIQKLDQLQDPDKVEAWLARIAINKAKNTFRGKVKAEALSKDLPTPDTMDEALCQDAERALLSDAISHLSDDHQIVIYLKYVRGFTSNQVAQALDLPEGTVKSRLHRARETMRNYCTAKEGIS